MIDSKDFAPQARSEPESSSEKPHPSEFLEFCTTAPQVAKVTRTDPIEHIQIEDSQQISHTKSNDDLFSGLSAAVPGLRRLSLDARAATQAEHKMTFAQGCRLYPRAIAWSVLLSLTIVMEGYDLTLINSFYAFPVFRRAYGKPIHPTAASGTRDYQISPAWQSGLTNAALIGEIIGLLFNGLMVDRFGYHRTLVLTLIWLSLFVFLAFFAVNIQMLLAAQILCGLSWGVFQTLSTTYAAEVMPVALRAYLTSNVNMCWLIGQVIGVGVIRGLVHNNSQWAYRIPFGLQWAFSVPVLIGVCFAPESPWWLIRHGRQEDAKRALLRLTSRNLPDFNADETIAMMEHTNEVEKYLNEGVSYLDCFKGTALRRTEIASLVWVTQMLTGAALTGYAAYFYEQAGFATANAFSLSVGMYALAIVGGIISWACMRWMGRRTIYLVGLTASFVVLLVMGLVGLRPNQGAISWTVGSLLIFLTFIYDMTIGPVCYVLVAEIPSTRLRVKTVVLARVAYNLISLVTNVIVPKMLNPTAWNLQGKSALPFAATTLLCFIWCWYRLPEPMGLTYCEMDILFEKRAKARKFREFQVNLAQTGYFSLSRSERGGSVFAGYA